MVRIRQPLGVAITAAAIALFLQQLRPEETEQWTPEPPEVQPPAAGTARPPSDAIVLLGTGHSLGEWISADGKSPAQWLVRNGVMTVKKGTGNIQTRRCFSSYQLHLEWRIPVEITGEGQARGNSGLFLASTGPGDAGYELQILDSYRNRTYVNGQAGSVYKQHPPLVNAMRPPGEWQAYDVIWTAPSFNSDGSLRSPARVTAFHNGVLIQHDAALTGETVWQGRPRYRVHGPAPIKLQDHGDPSPPVSFRNIWVRPLAGERLAPQSPARPGDPRQQTSPMARTTPVLGGRRRAHEPHESRVSLLCQLTKSS